MVCRTRHGRYTYSILNVLTKILLVQFVHSFQFYHSAIHTTRTHSKSLSHFPSSQYGGTSNSGKRFQPPRGIDHDHGRYPYVYPPLTLTWMRQTKQDGDEHEKELEHEQGDCGDGDGDDDEDGWGLEEDWALQDQVPNYTVQSTTTRRSDAEVVTFWTQLKHATPELSGRSEDELEDRYRRILSVGKRKSQQMMMIKEKEDANTNVNVNAEKDEGIGSINVAKNECECGPSPPLLSDWWVEYKSGSGTLNNNRGISRTSTATATTIIMGGTLVNGSKIWFPLQCAGNLPGDPLVDDNDVNGDVNDDDFSTLRVPPSATASFSNYLGTPGYAEASGGRIYELGSPHPKMMMMMNQETLRRAPPSSNDRVDLSTSTQGQLAHHNSSLGSDAKRWILGIVTASALSAYVAFGVGSGQTAGRILSNSAVVTTHTPPPPPQTTIVRVVKMSNNPTIVTAGASTGDASELSIAAQRARQELKVEREKLGLVRLQDKINVDEAKLNDLRKEEFRQEAADNGF